MHFLVLFVDQTQIRGNTPVLNSEELCREKKLKWRSIIYLLQYIHTMCFDMNLQTVMMTTDSPQWCSVQTLLQQLAKASHIFLFSELHIRCFSSFLQQKYNHYSKEEGTKNALSSDTRVRRNTWFHWAPFSFTAWHGSLCWFFCV